MLVDWVQKTANAAGLKITHVDRVGVEPELDLARLTADRPIKTIFDVGGNFGQTAVRFASAFPGATVYTFEPVPSSYQKLLEAIKPYPAIRPLNVAMGERAGSASINVGSDAGKNSLIDTPLADHAITVAVRTVDEVASEMGLAEIDLLKVDVEGFELPVLRGAEALLASGKIRYVFVECVFSADTDMPHTSFFDLHRRLDAAGFCFFASYPESFNLRIGCAMANVLFALRSALPTQVPGKVKNIF